MKVNSKIITFISGIVLLLIVGNIFLYNRSEKFKTDAERERSNFVNAKIDSAAYREFELKMDRKLDDKLSLLFPEIKKLIDSNGIKEKWLRNINHYYTTEKIYHVIPDSIDQENEGVKIWRVREGCFDIKGRSTDIPVLDHMIYNNEITDIQLELRNKLFGWSWMPRWGHKSDSVFIHTKCGTTQKQRISFIK